MSFVNDLENDEIRNEFLVTSDRKRLWNAEIELIVFFDEICRKYGLKYFATEGTLLGAVRHGGFIPWDDDVDLAMPRADYERLKQIAAKEIRYPFYFDLWCNNVDPTDDRQIMWWPHVPFLKIRNSRTTMIEFPNRSKINQGIWIDIFPLDPVPSFDSDPMAEKIRNRYEVIIELFMLACQPQKIREQMHKEPNRKFLIPRGEMEKILSLPLRGRGKILEDHLAKFDHDSKFCAMGLHGFKNPKSVTTERNWWKETVYLQFEGISLPAPREFVKVLERRYGNWKKFVRPNRPHTTIFSTTIPYHKYFESREEAHVVR